MRAFHEHYMPSGEILAHALEEIRGLRLHRIAPQHGLVIPEDLAMPLLDRLAELECGIYLLARDDPGLEFLLTAHSAVRDVVDILVREADFSVVVARLAEIARRLFGAEDLELWARTGNTVLRFGQGDGFGGLVAQPPVDVLDALSGATPATGPRLVIPLRSSSSGLVSGVALFEFRETPAMSATTRALVDQVCDLVEVGLERELFRQVAAIDRAAFYEQAIHDPLTGLHNRQYLVDTARRMCALDDRNQRPALAALMIDLDHFKEVNDAFVIRGRRGPAARCAVDSQGRAIGRTSLCASAARNSSCSYPESTYLAPGRWQSGSGRRWQRPAVTGRRSPPASV